MPRAIKERSLPLPSSFSMITQHLLTVERGQLDSVQIRWTTVLLTSKWSLKSRRAEVNQMQETLQAISFRSKINLNVRIDLWDQNLKLQVWDQWTRSYWNTNRFCWCLTSYPVTGGFHPSPAEQWIIYCLVKWSLLRSYWARALKFLAFWFHSSLSGCPKERICLVCTLSRTENEVHRVPGTQPD